MLIATFGPTTAWVGKQITGDGDAFVLEGHGPISASDVMEYDQQGHLVWVNDGTRAWVGSKARRLRVSNAAPATATQEEAKEAQEATRDVGSEPSSRARTHLTRALLLAIAALIVTNVVLILAVLGAFRGP